MAKLLDKSQLFSRAEVAFPSVEELKKQLDCVQGDIRHWKMKKTSNDIVAGNGRVLKLNLFIVWLYLLKKHLIPGNRVPE